MKQALTLGGAFMFMLLLLNFSTDMTATDIVRKSEQKLRGNSNEVEMAINIVRPSWKRSLVAKSWSKGSENALILITSPARDKGTVFLKREKEIWNYVPTIERTIKLPPSMMMQSWMGTDFKNDDLVRESSMVKDYEHALLGEETLRDVQCYKVEFDPKPEAPVVWGKLIVWISKDEYLQVRAEFYDEEDEMVQVMEGFDFTDFDGRVLPARVRMTPMEEDGHYTEMVYSYMKFDMDIEESFFTTQNMKRVR